MLMLLQVGCVNMVGVMVHGPVERRLRCKKKLGNRAQVSFVLTEDCLESFPRK